MNKRGNSVDIRNKFPALLQFLQDQRKIVEYECSEIKCSTNEFNKQKIHLINEGHEINNTDLYMHRDVEDGYSKNRQLPYEQVFQMSGNSFQRCIEHNNSSRHTMQDSNHFKDMDIKTRIQLIKERITGGLIMNCFLCKIKNWILLIHSATLEIRSVLGVVAI